MDKQHKLLINCLAKKLKMFQEQWDQRSTNHNKKYIISIDLSANKTQVSQETAHQLLKG